MRIRRALRIALLCVSAVALANPAPEIASLYVEEALQALRGGDLDQVQTLAERALEFDPRSSDALTLGALASLAEQRRTLQNTDLLESALEHDRFMAVPAALATISLASLYNRAGDHMQAHLLLELLEVPPTASWDLRADYWYERVRSLYGMQEFAQGDPTLETARDLHPNDARLVRLLISREPFPSLEFRRELERMIGSLNRATEFDRLPAEEALGELLLTYGFQAPTDEERQWAATEYIRLGFSDPLVSVLLLDDDPERAVELFERFVGERSVLTLQEFAARDRFSLIEASVAQFSGTSRLDEDRDGFWEIEFEIRDGVVERMVRDSDQDGESELAIRFADGQVDGATLRSTDRRLELTYELYPFVHQMAVVTEAGEERFVLRPRSAVVRLLERVPDEGVRLALLPQLLREIRTPDLAEVRTLALRIDRYDLAARRIERIYQADGAMVLIARDENHDGEWDSFSVQSGGFAVRQVRDIDFDSYFEVVEEFRGGRRVAMAVDEDDDGFPEILEYERTTTIRDWDLNEDGRIDVREFLNWSDSVIREFPLAEQE